MPTRYSCRPCWGEQILSHLTQWNLFVGPIRPQRQQSDCTAVLGEIFGFDSSVWIRHFLCGGRDFPPVTRLTPKFNLDKLGASIKCPVETPNDGGTVGPEMLSKVSGDTLRAKRMWTRGHHINIWSLNMFFHTRLGKRSLSPLLHCHVETGNKQTKMANRQLKEDCCLKYDYMYTEALRFPSAGTKRLKTERKRKNSCRQSLSMGVQTGNVAPPDSQWFRTPVQPEKTWWKENVIGIKRNRRTYTFCQKTACSRSIFPIWKFSSMFPEDRNTGLSWII